MSCPEGPGDHRPGAVQVAWTFPSDLPEPPLFRRVWIVIAVLAITAGAGSIVAGTRSHSVSTASRWVVPGSSTPAEVPSTPASPAPASKLPPSPPPVSPLLRPGPVTIDSPGFWSWALLNTRTGELAGAQNLAATSTTVSMVKAWIVADYLRLEASAGRTPSQARLGELSTVIRDSDNEAAERIFQQIGAANSINRMISICRLTETKPYLDWWSNTSISARDTARLAGCIGDGRAAGPRWTDWVLNEMRHVRPPGDFGILEALPPDVAENTAIKNGWLLRAEDGLWHIACLAIGEGWTLGVLARYPGSLGFGHGTNICKSVASQLLHPVA